MYVCVCKAVTEGQIKRAMSEGLCTRRELFKCLGVGADCGKCNPQVKEMLSDHKHVCNHHRMQKSLNPIILAA
jgi:bacterioferritin-associated ferredoxin